MTLILKAEKRTVLGKKLVKDRALGKLPVVIYGRKEKPTAFFVNTKEFKKIFTEAGESSIVTLQTADGEKDTLIHDVQIHPVSEEPIHVDFYAIEKDRKVEVSVPLVFGGESPAVKGLNAILIKVMHELLIEALPKDLPHEINVDLSSLKVFGAQIHVKDLVLPTGVNTLSEADEVVALVEEAKEEVEESVAPDLDSIEVEKKGKQETAEDAGGESTSDGDKK